MTTLAVLTLALLQFAPIQGARMPRNNVLGIRLDMLRKEAHLVLGRKQGLMEVEAPQGKSAYRYQGTPVQGSTAASEARGDLWRIEDGHSSALEIPVSRARRADARMLLMKSGRPLRNLLLGPEFDEDGADTGSR